MTDRRMSLARQALASGSAASVSEVAFAYGFEHLGRFSIAYRARFGESPRETLRRGRPAG
jgi:AraC-like DNA-binding protein